MKKIQIEIELEENENTDPIYLPHDICEALVRFKDDNLAWSKIKSVSWEGITCINTGNSFTIGKA